MSYLPSIHVSILESTISTSRWNCKWKGKPLLPKEQKVSGIYTWLALASFHSITHKAIAILEWQNTSCKLPWFFTNFQKQSFLKSDISPIHVGRRFRIFALKSRFIQNFELWKNNWSLQMNGWITKSRFIKISQSCFIFAKVALFKISKYWGIICHCRWMVELLKVALSKFPKVALFLQKSLYSEFRNIEE